MRIDSELDLSRAELKFPLAALQCAFSENILLRDAQLRGLSLAGSHMKGGLNASHARIEGSVFFGEGFDAEGGVNLLGATIGGDLDCEGARFSNANGIALFADGAKIGGSVFLRNGFKADGGVRLLSATIPTLVIHNVLEAEPNILDLRFAKVGTFWDDENSWPKPGNLFLDGFRYERLYEESPLQADTRKKWLRLQPQDKFLPQPYEQLAAVLRQMGHERDARLVMIEKNR